MSTISPEFGTDGNYAKCWIRESEGIFLYKTGSKQYEVEPLSEFLASQLAAVICPSYVKYDLGLYRGKLVSKCELFTSEAVGLAKAAGVFQNERTIPTMLNYFAQLLLLKTTTVRSCTTCSAPSISILPWTLAK